MGLLDDYLAADEGAASKPAVAAKPAVGGSLLQQYMDEPSSVPVAAKPTPVANGIPTLDYVSGSDAKPAIKYVDKKDVNNSINPRDGEIVRDARALPSEMLSGILEKASAGAKQASTDAYADLSSGKPASAVGNVGMGVLQMATSPVAGPLSKAVDFGTKLTGNKEFAEKAGDVASLAVPVVPGAIKINKALPSNKAIDEIVSKVTSEGREPQKLVDLVQRMKENPRIGPADESPAVLSMAQKLFTTEGDAAKNHLHSTSTNRIANSAATSTAAFDTASGLPVNAVTKLKELKDAAAKVGSEQINPAVTNAKPVNITPVIDHIDAILKPGVMKEISGESTLPFGKVKQAVSEVRDMIANNKEQLTDPQSLHTFQSALRNEATALMNSADGGQRQLGGALMQVRNKVVDAIDAASPRGKATADEILNHHGFSVDEISNMKPEFKKATINALSEAGEVVSKNGTYKPALANFREEKQIDEAFHDAYNGILSNSKKLENRPEFTEEWFKGLSKEEKEAAIQGIRTRIDTEIRVAGNPNNAATSLGKSDFNQKKLETMLGKEETTRLLKQLEDERKISNTHNKIVEGSQTAMRSAADQAVALPVKGENKGLAKYVIPAVGTAAEIGSTALGGPAGLGGAIGLAASTLGIAGSKAGSAAKFAIETKLAKERNLHLARYSLPTEGPARDALIQQLEARIPGPKQSLVNRVGGTLSRVVNP